MFSRLVLTVTAIYLLSKNIRIIANIVFIEREGVI